MNQENMFSEIFKDVKTEKDLIIAIKESDKLLNKIIVQLENQIDESIKNVPWSDERIEQIKKCTPGFYFRDVMRTFLSVDCLWSARREIHRQKEDMDYREQKLTEMESENKML